VLLSEVNIFATGFWNAFSLFPSEESDEEKTES
jgi:hypothetical protein